MKKILSLIIAAVMCFGMMSTIFAAEMNFVDVQADAWYYEDVRYAVENGLINGKTSSLFAPDSPLTGVEAIKLAACMHQLYTEGAVSLKSGFPWYKPYEDYCLDNEIIDKEYSRDQPITRGDFVVIFSNTLPEDAYNQINEIEYGAIPDVNEGDEYYEAAYKLYRAGILTGSGDEHRLMPEASIKRAEVAAIVTRMIDDTRRVEFSIEKAENEESNFYVNVNVSIGTFDESTEVNVDDTQGNVNFTDGSRNDNTDDSGAVNGNVVVNDVVVNAQDNTVVNGEVLTGQGNTVVNILALSIKLQPVSFKITEIPIRASFTVEVTGGTGPYTYQWECQTDKVLGDAWIKMPAPVTKRGVTSKAKYSGSTTKTLVVAVAKDNIDVIKHKYRCVITDANGNEVISNVVGFDTAILDSASEIKLPIKGLR